MIEISQPTVAERQQEQAELHDIRTPNTVHHATQHTQHRNGGNTTRHDNIDARGHGANKEEQITQREGMI